MKVALVHDYIKEYGGAEKVLESLHETYPDADVFTSIYCPKYLGPHRERFKNWKIKTSLLQHIPFKEKLISPFRLISPFVFRRFDFSKYDVVIVSATGAYTPNAIRKRNATHICYYHTPPRYLYGYKTARNWESSFFSKIIGNVMNHFLRVADFCSAQNVDLCIANSEEVKRRIWKFYRKKAVVVYPPVDTSRMRNVVSSRQKNKINNPYSILHSTCYYLAGGRLARAKRVDLAVKACTKLKVPLKVFGKSFAGYGEELKKMSTVDRRQSTVEFVREVTEEEKYKLMMGAKAYIFPSDTEDFGITPVEAMSVGCPVIAYKSGGVLETIVDGKTGVFFDSPSQEASGGHSELTVESLIKAIKRLSGLKIKPEDCINQAKKFSKERFIREISRIVASRM